MRINICVTENKLSGRDWINVEECLLKKIKKNKMKSKTKTIILTEYNFFFIHVPISNHFRILNTNFKKKKRTEIKRLGAIYNST